MHEILALLVVFASFTSGYMARRHEVEAIISEGRVIAIKSGVYQCSLIAGDK